MRTERRTLSSILAFMLCLSLIVGATYALFTSKDTTNIAINSGKAEVVAEVTDLALYSQEKINLDNNVGTRVDVVGETFPNGGTAKYADGTLTLDKLTPGDGVTFNISVTNNSNVAVICRTIISGVSGNGLINALVITIDGEAYTGEAISEWTALEVGETLKDIAVSIELPADAGNAYMNRTASLSIVVEAVQGNAVEVIDEWDGSAVADDFAAEEDGTYLIESAADLAAFAEAVKAGDNFAGKTVTLNSNIDLAGNAWTPIGYGTINVPVTGNARNEVSFAGTFDGQGYTISNISINPGSDDDSANRKWGFFVGIAADGVVKNLTLKNVSVNDVTRNMTAIGSLAGTLYGKVENCHVKNVAIDGNTRLQYTGGLIGAAYNNAVIDKCSVDGVNITCSITSDNGEYVAGVVGYAGGDTTTRVNIKNTTLENCTVNNLEINVADYYLSVGGFIGDATNGTELKNCDVNGAIINVARVTSGGAVGGFAAGTLAINDTRTLLFEECDVTGLYITAEGNVMGSGVVVGFLGSVANPVVVNNCSVEGVINATAAPHPSNGVVGTVAAFANTTVNGEGNTDNVTIK